jgi:hypothetical protein
MIGGASEGAVQNIVSNQITPPDDACVLPVDASGGGTLNTIAVTYMRDGQVIFLHSVSALNPITIANLASGSGVPIATYSGQSIVLSNPAVFISLKYNATLNQFQEIFPYPNWGAPGAIGSVTPNSAAFSSMTLSTPLAVSSGGTGAATSSAGTVFGNFSGSTAAPSFNPPGSMDQVLGVAHSGGGLEYKTITPGTNISVTFGTASITINATTPMTTLGDTLYGGTGGAITRLAGSLTTTKQFLTQTGTGSASAAPAWGSITLTDLPGSVVNTTNNQSAGTVFGNFSASSGPPSYNAAGSMDQVLAVQHGGAGLEYKTIQGGTNITVTGSSGALTISTSAAVISNPMTSVGDMIYGGASGAASKLAGTTSVTKQFLTQTGTGSASAAPNWGAIALGDLPSSVVNTSTSQGAGTIFGNFSGSSAAPSFQAPGSANQLLGVTNPGGGLEYKTISGTGSVSVNFAAGAITISTTALSNPMSTLGDIIYGGTSGTASRLAGTTSATKQFLTQTGTGSVSAAPGWGAIVLGDLPSTVVNTSTSQSAGTIFGNFSGSSAAPSFQAPGSTNQLLGVTNSGAGLEYKTISGTGIISVALAAGTITISSSGFANPMTTLGDIIYGGSSGAASRLAGTTSATKQFLTQTGTGGVSAAPGWGAIVLGDLPSTVVNTSTSQSAGTLFGNFSGSSAAPTFHAPGSTNQLLGVANSGGGLEYKTISGTGIISVALAGGTITISSSGFANPMSTLGDIIYGGSSGAASRLAGTTSTTKQFLTQTGTGSASASPGWGAIVLGDLPSSVVNTSTSQSAGTLFGNFSGSSSAPTFHAPGITDQLLGVAHSGGGLEYKTLVAGTNITLTPTAGQIKIDAAGGGSASFPLVNQCRLYGVSTTGTPQVPMNCYADTPSTGITKFFFGACPGEGNSIQLYSGGAWGLVAVSSELNFDLTTVTLADNIYDIYVYNNGGTAKIETPSVGWTVSGTTPPIVWTPPARDLQDGVIVKSGDPTRLWVGIIQVISGTVYNWTGNRGIWNAYNRIQAPVLAVDSNPSWSFSGGVRIQRSQSATSYGAGVIQIATGAQIDAINLNRFVRVQPSSYTVAALFGIGLDQVAYQISGEVFATSYTTAGTNTSSVHYSTTQIGTHYYANLEQTSGGSCLWYGTAATSGIIYGGMYGTTWW